MTDHTLGVSTDWCDSYTTFVTVHYHHHRYYSKTVISLLLHGSSFKLGCMHACMHAFRERVRKILHCGCLVPLVLECMQVVVARESLNLQPFATAWNRVFKLLLLLQLLDMYCTCNHHYTAPV